MANSLFREKSLETVSSPEQLDSYTKVIGSGSWCLCIALVLLILGSTLWGFFGKLKSYVNTVATVEDICVTAYIRSEEYSKIENGQKCSIEGVTFNVEKMLSYAYLIDDVADEFTIMKGGFYYGEYVYVLKFDNKNIPNGVYDCKIEVGEVSPFSFLSSTNE